MKPVGLFAVHPAISSVRRCLVARNFCWDVAFRLPSSPAHALGVSVLWTDRHVLLAFLGDEFPEVQIDEFTCINFGREESGEILVSV